MHFLRTIVVTFLTLTAVSAAPLQKRDIVGDPTSPVDDLLTNVEGGLEGLTTFATGESSKARRDLPESLDATVEGVVGFLEGGQGRGLKARQTTNSDNIVDAAVNGVEGAAAALSDSIEPIIGEE